MIVAVGWPGQWAATFARNEGSNLHLSAGQALTRFRLHPGEEVRSPLMVVQFWSGGDWIRAQNIWRRWMMAHSMPRPGGRPPRPQFVASSSRAYGEMIGANTQNQTMHINRYLEEGLELDYWWAVPLWRSDYAYEATGHQGMTYGISLWLPYHGTATVACDDAPYYGSGPTPVQPYAFWSNAAPSLGCGIDIGVKEIDYAALGRLVAQWRRISEHYYGDFYPLTPYSLDKTLWMAWQFHGPQPGQGLIQAFRRPHSPYEAARFRLRGLDPKADYLVSNVDRKGWEKRRGRELLEDGLLVTIGEKPGVAVLTYKQADH